MFTSSIPESTYSSLSTTDLPLDILNADFLAGLVIVIIPFSLREIDAGERCIGLNASGLEVALGIGSACRNRKSYDLIRPNLHRL